jgi:serine/threonine protein kinase
MKLGLPTGAEACKAAVTGDQSDVPTMATPPAGFVPPSPAELAGQFPQLEILELLGQGGMGAVYKARQKQLDRLVALKILPPQIGETEAFAERFTREARSLAMLNHPHIVTVHDFGKTEAGLYFFIIGLGSLFLVVAAGLFSLLAIPGIASGKLKDMAILSAFGAALALLPLVSAVWDLVGGVGLLKRRRWARILVLIGAVPELFVFPVGTATGIYTIWVLMQKETIQLLTDDPTRA